MRVVNGGEELDVKYEYLEVSRYVKVYKTFLVWENNLEAL